MKIDDSRYHKEELIKTRELPIISFCVVCDKPIYIGDEYEEIEYFDDGGHKKFDKKHLSKGFAHKHCADQMHEQVHQLRHKHLLKSQYVLALSLVIGFAFALALMMILIFTVDRSLLALSIILPWVIGYFVFSTVYIYLSNSRLGELFRNSSMFLIKSPINTYTLDFPIPVVVLLLIILVPLAYVALIIWVCILSIIAGFALPVLMHKLVRKA